MRQLLGAFFCATLIVVSSSRAPAQEPNQHRSVHRAADSAPYNDNEPGHSADASGAWSNYPFFKSGVIVFTSVREGLFIVKAGDRPVF